MLPAYERRNMLNTTCILNLYLIELVSSIKGVNTTSKGVIIPVVIGHKLCEGIIIEISGISELNWR